MKRVMICIMLIFSLSFFYGFSPQKTYEKFDDFIMLSLDFSSNGQIVQSIDFSVNSGWVNNEALSIKETIEFRKALTKNIESIRSEFLFSYALLYMQNPNEEYKINKGLLLSGVTYNETSDTLGFKMCFTSVGAWEYYHPTKQNENQEKTNKRKNIFLNKVKSVGVFPFSSVVKVAEKEEKTIGRRYQEKYISSAEGLSFWQKLKNQYKPRFIYNYSAFNAKLRSDSQYKFSDQQQHTHHIWIVENDNLNEKNSISLYYYQINKGAWIIAVLTISLTAMLISIISIKFSKKKK